MIPDVEPLVAISALEHHLYCPRQCALIHVDGVWADNEHTVRGDAGHRRADSAVERVERGALSVRSLPLWSERLGLSGRADVVMFGPGDRVVPVEYKIGTRHEQSADVQLCAQALCLEEMLGVEVPAGLLWLSAPRRRVTVDFGAHLRDETLAAILEVRNWLVSDRLPPAPADERCRSCQLLDSCQPELCHSPDRVIRYLAEVIECDF